APVEQFVGQVLPGVHVAGRLVLVDEGHRDLVEVAVRVPERRQVQRAVEQWDHRQYHQRRRGQPAAQEPAQLETGESHRWSSGLYSMSYSIAVSGASRAVATTA